MIAKFALLLLAAAFTGCDQWQRPLPDGGYEYALPDGGWVQSGDGCSCDDEIALALVNPEGHTLLTCAPVGCTRDTCGGVGVCFGDKCCTWQFP